MQSFPMFIRTTGRRVVIAGGGEQAAQKARLMLKADATLVLVAPELDDELTADLNRNGINGAAVIFLTVPKAASRGQIAQPTPAIRRMVNLPIPA